MSTVVQQLFETYRLENIDMPYTLQDFQKDYVRDHLSLLSPDDRLKGLSLSDIINHLSPIELKKLRETLENTGTETHNNLRNS
ncbi:MAG: hypothetical protein EPN21_16580 [Methylococcaceae bacterium]|nr:MAG: hypothetical protein EPN21_16580 [Methylococcaceae bacterium]